MLVGKYIFDYLMVNPILAVMAYLIAKPVIVHIHLICSCLQK